MAGMTAMGFLQTQSDLTHHAGQMLDFGSDSELGDLRVEKV